jgi:cellulose synthase/poly-beta-1,6-N-acetylglucosamine synthase-like glycosyltransferase
MDTGNVEIEALRAACLPFPWIRIIRLPIDTRYFEAKVAGARMATGDVVVFCDADNIYLPGWLRSMVSPFEDPEINVLVGQTSVRISSVYSTVFALSFFFPPFESGPGLAPADHYYGNNSALRRAVLEQVPIPTDLPVLRGNDYLHSAQLRKLGYAIWRQRDARAFHESPDNLEELVRRYLARGNDRVMLLRLARPFLSEMAGGRRPPSRLVEAAGVVWENMSDLAARTIGVIRSAPHSLRYFPLAFPLSLALLLVVGTGMGVSLFRPGHLVESYLRRYHPQAGRLPRSRIADLPAHRT